MRLDTTAGYFFLSMCSNFVSRQKYEIGTHAKIAHMEVGTFTASPSLPHLPRGI